MEYIERRRRCRAPPSWGSSVAATKYRSVVSRPTRVSSNGAPFINFIFRAAEVADAIPLWSTNPAARDRLLKTFWKTEDMLKTAIFSMVARYAAMRWTLTGPPRTRSSAFDVLNGVEDAYGWEVWLQKLWLETLTQDNGGFTQVIRTEDSPDAPMVSLKHLESARCRRTGVLDQPVVYWDDNNLPHILKDYQVADFVHLVAPEERAYGAGMSAVSLILEDARYMRDVAIYAHEKVSGRNPRAVHFVGGVSGKAMRKALEDHKALSENKGALYIDPPIIPGNDPTATVSKVTLEMASLYDGFDEDKAKRWFYVALCNALGVDYQEFLPLPAGNLGTSQQSNILSMKGNTKGPALFQAQITHFMNYRGVLPRSVRFDYLERDPSFEAARLTQANLRATNRAIRLKSGEITDAIARQLAVRDGDLPEEYLSLVGESNLDPSLVSIGPGGYTG